MTLAAAILLSGMFSLTSISPRLIFQSESSPATPISENQSGKEEQPSQNPGTAESAKPKSDQTSKGSVGKPKSTGTKRSRTRKKVSRVNCDPATSKTTAAGSDPAGPPSGTAASPGATTGGDAMKPCPPAKVVVRQGGISEQSIQLAGGKGGNDASQKRDAANSMLAATEENLKTVSTRQLNSAQQDSASQIRQFVKQSKSAMAAGDLERAQTLAWKAKLLSEDLVNPGK